jgi:hypothetical protein
VHEIQRDCVFMVFDFLGVGIGQPSKPAVGHADSKVVALAERT